MDSLSLLVTRIEKISGTATDVIKVILEFQDPRTDAQLVVKSILANFNKILKHSNKQNQSLHLQNWKKTNGNANHAPS